MLSDGSANPASACCEIAWFNYETLLKNSRWHQYRKYDRFWMDELELCPPTLTFAIADMGIWAPDPNCNMYGSSYNELNCLQHRGAQHCVVNLKPT